MNSLQIACYCLMFLKSHVTDKTIEKQLLGPWEVISVRVVGVDADADYADHVDALRDLILSLFQIIHIRRSPKEWKAVLYSKKEEFARTVGNISVRSGKISFQESLELIWFTEKKKVPIKGSMMFEGKHLLITVDMQKRPVKDEPFPDQLVFKCKRWK
ncbi:MAG: hypothetical protein R3B84_14720 [Zavarzinella sp.]